MHDILDRELAELSGDTSRLLLGGCSQGCGTALDALLQYRLPLGGFVGTIGHLLSCTPTPSDKARVPLYFYNGDADETMRWGWVRKSPSSRRVSRPAPLVRVRK